MSTGTATDAYCQKCRRYTPIMWTMVEIAEVHADGVIRRFEGGEVRCRLCDFEITKIGRVLPEVRVDA